MKVRNQRIIHTAVLTENMREIRRHIPASVKVLAVVKADAYGHGVIHTAKAVLEGGADMLAVATAEEGAILRKGSIDAPVLVLGAVSEAEVETGVRNGLIQTVCSTEMVRMCEAAAVQLGKTAEVHLKIDTGMGRIGIRSEEELSRVLEALEHCSSVRLTGAFTHFADADGDTTEYTVRQFAIFKRLTALLPSGLTLHCANSAAIHRFPDMAMNMVRAGISMYGYPPVETDWNLKPAMEWIAGVSYVKDVEAGETISYGRIYTAEKKCRVATVTCGYGDGYHRAATEKAAVLLHGRRAPVVGRICMDQMMVDVSDIPDVQPGDQAVLMGSDGNETLDAEDLAKAAGTISYEILLAATDRVDREWI